MAQWVKDAALSLLGGGSLPGLGTSTCLPHCLPSKKKKKVTLGGMQGSTGMQDRNIQQMFIEHLLCARRCSRCWDASVSKTDKTAAVLAFTS